MKLAASTAYGTAGPAFVRSIVEKQIEGRHVRELVDAFVKKALKGVTGDHGQLARRRNGSDWSRRRESLPSNSGWSRGRKACRSRTRRTCSESGLTRAAERGRRRLGR
jgi:hypothetical protein